MVFLVISEGGPMDGHVRAFSLENDARVHITRDGNAYYDHLYRVEQMCDLDTGRVRVAGSRSED